MKKYLVYKENEKTSWITPIPLNYKDIWDTYIELDELPVLETNEMYDIANEGINEGVKKLVAIPLNNIAKEALKEEKIQQIDLETQREISKGFEFDGYRFSLSQKAQLNWQGLLLLFQSGLFESQEISTKENSSYLLKKEKLIDFIKAGSTVISSTLKLGRDKKQQL